MGGEAVHFADDVFLRHVHQTAGHVARVGSTQGGIGQRLAGAVRGKEELKHGQALAEVGADGQLDDLARRRGHQAAHAGQLADLVDGTAGAGGGHHVDGVELVQRVHDLLGDVVGGLLPDADDRGIALVFRHAAAAEGALDVVHFVLRVMEDGGLLRRHDDVGHGNGQRAARGVLEAQRLDVVEHLRGDGDAVGAVAVVDDAAKLLFAHDLIDLKLEHVVQRIARLGAQILRNGLVEDHAADGGLHHLLVLLALPGARQAYVALGLQGELARGVGHQRLVHVGEVLALALGAGADDGEVVAAQHHVLRRGDDGLAVLRL